MAQLLIDIFKRVMKNKNFALYRSGLKNDVSRIDYLQRFIRSFILESTSAKGIQAGGLKKGRGKIRKYLTSEKCGRNRSRIVKELYYNRSIKQLYAFVIIFLTYNIAQEYQSYIYIYIYTYIQIYIYIYIYIYIRGIPITPIQGYKRLKLFI